MFDFDRDGYLNAMEMAAECYFLNRMEDEDVFGDAGLDYDELERMDPWERRSVLEDAGLDPDDYDF